MRLRKGQVAVTAILLAITTILNTRGPGVIYEGFAKFFYLLGVRMAYSDPHLPMDIDFYPKNKTLDIELENTTHKLILFWTSNKNPQSWWSKLASGHLEFQDCEYSNCQLSRDQSVVQFADMVVFKDNDEPSFPKRRWPNQLYVHQLSERPGRWHRWLSEFESKINLTMNYRTDADILYRLNGFRPHSKPRRGRYTPKADFAQRRFAAVWPVSNCDAHSDRHLFAQELSKYIPVHVYGRCGEHICDKEDRLQCSKRWEYDYMFYLSFENAVCRDYITEKLYNPLQYELVPIVFGGGHYDIDAPPHSVINVRHFRSPKDLGAFLVALSKNETRYHEYFQWKTRYEMMKQTEALSGVVCDLCAAVNTVQNKTAYSDYYQWWFSGCDNNVVWRMRWAGRW